jgi:hypothetical protein
MYREGADWLAPTRRRLLPIGRQPLLEYVTSGREIPRRASPRDDTHSFNAKQTQNAGLFSRKNLIQ